MLRGITPGYLEKIAAFSCCRRQAEGSPSGRNDDLRVSGEGPIFEIYMVRPPGKTQKATTVRKPLKGETF